MTSIRRSVRRMQFSHPTGSAKFGLGWFIARRRRAARSRRRVLRRLGRYCRRTAGLEELRRA